MGSEHGAPCFKCSAFDLLPIPCAECHQLFCKEHAQSAAHDCPASDPNTTSQTTQRATQTQSTSFKSFLPDSDRPVIRPERIDPRSKNAAALELLKKNFPSTSSQKQSKSTSQLKKPLNPVLAGRILKQKATPADPKRPDVPLDRRRYLNISIPPKSEQTPVWLDKDISVGKALDLLIAKLQVQSSNLTASLNDSNRLWLFHDDKKLTLNSQTISESSLRDGDTVTIASGKQMQEKST